MCIRDRPQGDARESPATAYAHLEPFFGHELLRSRRRHRHRPNAGDSDHRGGKRKPLGTVGAAGAASEGRGPGVRSRVSGRVGSTREDCASMRGVGVGVCGGVGKTARGVPTLGTVFLSDASVLPVGSAICTVASAGQGSSFYLRQTCQQKSRSRRTAVDALILPCLLYTSDAADE